MFYFFLLLLALSTELLDEKNLSSWFLLYELRLYAWLVLEVGKLLLNERGEPSTAMRCLFFNGFGSSMLFERLKETLLRPGICKKQVK